MGYRGQLNNELRAVKDKIDQERYLKDIREQMLKKLHTAKRNKVNNKTIYLK